MRNPIILLLALPIIIFSAACSKDNTGKSDLLAGSTWKVVAMVSDRGGTSTVIASARVLYKFSYIFNNFSAHPF